MFLVSLEMGGRLHMPYVPYMRWGSHISILAVLVCMFVIPHDPSTRIPPNQVGSDAMLVSRNVPGWHSLRPAGLARQPPMPPSPFIVPPPAPGAPGSEGVPAHRLATRGAVLRSPRAREPMSVLTLPAESPLLPSNLTALMIQTKWRHSRSIAQLRRNFRRPVEVRTTVPGALAPGAVSIGANGTYVFTTVEALRQQHGQRKHWFGDLDARATRELYHELLPRHLLEDDAIELAERARLAVAARRAARLYARERALLPVALSCEFYDGMRTFMKQGTFQPGGLSEDQIWQKYQNAFQGQGSDVQNQIYMMVLEKSCTSNAAVDQLMGL